MRLDRRLVTFAVAATVFSIGCNGSLVPPPSDDWRLGIEPSTRTIDAEAALDPATRAALTVEMLGGPAAEDLGFAKSPVVDADGRLYALEMSTLTIRAFTPTGEQLWSAGGLGREPGQLFGPSILLLFGETLGVIDPAADRLSLWSLEGEHLDELESGSFLDVNAAVALDPERMVARLALEQQLRRQESLSILTRGGEEVVRIAFLPFEPADRGDIFPRPDFAVGDGRIFATTGDAYQVYSYDLSGEQQWALRVPWPRGEVTDEAIGRSLERTRRAGRAMGENVGGDRAVEFPSHFPALAALRTDGRGRVYVFPYVEDIEGTEHFPVDVYSPDGELLVHGTLPFQGWDASRNDEIYRLEGDVVANTSTITRYRITLPDGR